MVVPIRGEAYACNSPQNPGNSNAFAVRIHSLTRERTEGHIDADLLNRSLAGTPATATLRSQVMNVDAVSQT
jgi:hypothetical protein